MIGSGSFAKAVAQGSFLTALAVSAAAQPVPPQPPLPPPPVAPLPGQQSLSPPPTRAPARPNDRGDRPTPDRNADGWTPEGMAAIIAYLLSRPIDDRPVIDDWVTGMGNADLWEAAQPARRTSTDPDTAAASSPPYEPSERTRTAR